MRLSAMLLLMSCASDRWVPRRDTRVDTLCVLPPTASTGQISAALNGLENATYDYDPTAGFRFAVNYGCFSSSCTRQQTMTCSVSINATALTVVADVRWEALETASECTADCGFAQATCDTGPLEQGLYQITAGERRVTVSSDGEQIAPCARR